MYRIASALCLAALLFAGWPVPGHAATDTLDPAELAKPNVCPAFFTLTGDQCTPDKNEIGKLEKADCAALKFTFEPNAAGSSDKGRCTPTDGAASPAPECTPLSGRRARVIGAPPRCVYDNPIPVSEAGDYIGDCIKIKAVPSGVPVQPRAVYVVTAQTDEPTGDRKLTLVEARANRWYQFGCRTEDNGKMVSVFASTMNSTGATRSGYAYGALTMPYKYFVGEKSFVTQVPIGAYLGWRTGQAGSGWTTAAAFTLGSVKADTVDPTRLDAAGKPVVTGSADVAALSLAGGVMFDILKSPAGKPFKAGLFVGRDVVNSDPSISYRFNRKTWVALQIGYDFTDN